MEFFNAMVHELTNMKWSDYLDIIIVAFLLYKLLPMLRSAGAMKIVRTVIILGVVLWLTDILDMYTLNFLLQQVMSVGLIALIVLFQPELRRMLDRLGRFKLIHSDEFINSDPIIMGKYREHCNVGVSIVPLPLANGLKRYP